MNLQVSKSIQIIGMILFVEKMGPARIVAFKACEPLIPSYREKWFEIMTSGNNKSDPFTKIAKAQIRKEKASEKERNGSVVKKLCTSR